MKLNQRVDRLTEKQAKRALDQALGHLHWLTYGGEFAYEMKTRNKNFCMASMKEFEEAKEWLDDFFGRKDND